MEAGQRRRLGDREMSWAMVGRATVRMPEPMVLRKDTPVSMMIIREALLREISAGTAMEATSLSAWREAPCWDGVSIVRKGFKAGGSTSVIVSDIADLVGRWSQLLDVLYFLDGA